MLTLFLVLVLMPVLIFIELTIQQCLFKPGAEKINWEIELYQQFLKSASARSQEKIVAEWELFQQRYD